MNLVMQFRKVRIYLYTQIIKIDFHNAVIILYYNFTIQVLVCNSSDRKKYTK